MFCFSVRFEDAYLSTHVIAELPHCRVTHSCLLLMMFFFFFFSWKLLFLLVLLLILK